MPLQGDRLPPNTTQGVAPGYELLPLQGVLGTGVSLKIALRRICMVSNSNEQHALKGQKLLAQGNALGIKAISNAPCKGNSFILPGVLKLLPLQGDRLPPNTTQGVAPGYELLPLQGVLGTGVSLKIALRRICMVSNSNEQHALNQRSPAEGKGKGQ